MAYEADHIWEQGNICDFFEKKMQLDHYQSSL